jgi:hypothetical protein
MTELAPFLNRAQGQLRFTLTVRVEVPELNNPNLSPDEIAVRRNLVEQKLNEFKTQRSNDIVLLTNNIMTIGQSPHLMFDGGLINP